MSLVRGTILLRRRCVSGMLSTSKLSIVSSQMQSQLPKALASQFRSLGSTVATSEKTKGFMSSLYGPESNVASEKFKGRWLMAVPAFATHMCIGSPYAWSLMGDVLTRDIGVVASAASDWTLAEAALPLSIIFLMQGVCASLVGKWQMNVGPRGAMAAASVAFGGGMLLGAAAIHLHSLPLLYLGYGFLGGTGIGLAYTPPVQTLMQWLPDKKGIASGLTIAGFGSGALVFTPCIQALMKNFSKIPTYLGPAGDFVTKIVDGRLYADIDGKLVEVVEAGAKELAKLPYDLSEGLYVVGTGSTGAAESLAVMGAAYFSIMLASSLMIKKPHPSFVPEGMVVPSSAVSSSSAPVVVPVVDISVDEAMRKPQFHLLGVTFMCLSMGGMGLFSVAKPMMSEVFSGVLPTVVTAAFASQFLLTLSAANLGGRLGWSIVSDTIGRRAMFTVFTLGSVPVYLALPYLITSVVETGTAAPLYMFVGCTAAALSFMGGTFALLPAYEADLFGAKNVGAIHGRMLLYTSCAALAGPTLLLTLRSHSEKLAIGKLLETIDPMKFQETFGAPVEKAYELLQAKALTINKLMVLAPPGTLDPTPHLYDSTMMTMGGLMVLASVTHAMVRPLPPAAVVLSVKDIPIEVPFVEEKKDELVGDREIKK